MARYVTHTQLRQAQSSLTEGMVKLSKSLTNKDTFLSHSRLDKSEDVRGAFTILEKFGARVYVDTLDGEIAALDIGERCARVRRIVTECRKLVVLFSQKTHTSRWIPWELGLADGTHTVND